jgi:uncharacterized membrane protein
MVRPKLDHQRIGQAIALAERQTSAVLCVSIAPPFWGSVQSLAQKAFVRLKLHHTPERNAVLIFMVPWRRQFAVWGDVGIHTKVGQRDWDLIVFAMAERLGVDDPTSALEHGIQRVGVHLARYFPASPRSVIEGPTASEVAHRVDAE